MTGPQIDPDWWVSARAANALQSRNLLWDLGGEGESRGIGQERKKSSGRSERDYLRLSCLMKGSRETPLLLSSSGGLSAGWGRVAGG